MSRRKIRREWIGRPFRRRQLLGAAGIALALLFSILLFVRRDVTVAIGETLRFDDDAFTVVRVLCRGDVLGRPEAANTAHEELVVTLRYENRARRTGRTLDASALFRLVFRDGGESGPPLEAVPIGGKDDARPDLSGGPVGPGSSRTYRLVFDVPRGAAASLRLAYGGKTVQRFDDLVFGVRRLALDR